VSACILVVDDDADVLDAMQMLLEGSECEVLSATDGRKALELLRSGVRPSLILLDLMMPGMNGWQFIAEGNRERLLDEIPIVVLSGGRFREEDVLSLGVAGCLAKPVGVDRLMSTLRKYCPDLSDS
jgi:CheY-like chemotaxis protein